MIVPGGNILNMAMSVIQKQNFTYFPYISRTLLGNGNYSATYAAGQPVQGSVQPVPRTLYAAMGLDFQKNYFNFYVSQNIFDVKRNVSGDQFTYEGKNFQVLSKTSWFGVDGWDQVLCIQVTDY